MERRATRIYRIVKKNDFKQLIGLWGYIILEDNWITENDKILEDELGNEYKVLDFKKLKFVEHSTSPQSIMPTVLFTVKRSCIKLDKPIKPNMLLYTKTNNYQSKNLN